MKNRPFLLGFLALLILLEGCADINRSIQLGNEWQRTKNIEPLINALQDESSFVRGTSIEILGKTKDPRAVEPLIAVLKEDKSWQAREKAAEALGEIKDPRAVEPLIAVLKEDKSWEERKVREKAIRPLGEIKDPRAVEPLIAVLKEDNSREVRENVIWALGEIKDPRAVEPLIAVLKEDKSWQTREKAAETLGEIKDPRAVEPLIAVLKEDKSWQARATAAETLGEIKDPRAVEPLIAVLKEDMCWCEQIIKHNASMALWEIKDPRAVEPLINWASVAKDIDGTYQSFALMNEEKLLAPGKLGILSVANVGGSGEDASLAQAILGDSVVEKTNITLRKASIGKIIEENFVECFKYLAGYCPVIINASEEIGVTKGVTKGVVCLEWEFYSLKNLDYQKIKQKYNVDVIIILESHLGVKRYEVGFYKSYTTLSIKAKAIKLSNKKVLYKRSIPPEEFLKSYTLTCSVFNDIRDASVDSIRKSYQNCSKRKMIKLIGPFIYEFK